jgi:C-methyltransferase C-terminal domain/Putative zinc binding domain/Methyltransferase domain
MTVVEGTRLTPRGTETCRGCGSSSLASVLDLGDQPLANELPATPDDQQGRFPLHLRICLACGLGQVGEYVLPERIFGDYPYLSSMSESWVAHARGYAAAQAGRLGLGGDSWVLEVASNDGYLLREFIALGVGVLGVEPARNVAQIARAGGVDTISEFFGVDVARRIREERGAPGLIVANNVMAHVPDMDDFVGGFAALADDRTLISVENPTIMNMLRLGQFDTIYHEHFSYLSAHAVARIADRHNLELVDIEELPTHGGSYRYWLGRANAHPVSPAVDAAIARELEQGLLSEAVHADFAQRCGSTISGLQDWLDARRSSASRVVAYGAAAKGNTLLNAAGVDSSVILAAVDASPEKQGRYLPGSGIPILAPSALTHLAATDILLLPWNLRDEVSQLVSKVSPTSTLWIAVPEMEIVPT